MAGHKVTTMLMWKRERQRQRGLGEVGVEVRLRVPVPVPGINSIVRISRSSKSMAAKSSGGEVVLEVWAVRVAPIPVVCGGI
jgi:hypothetical protein